ncbi:RadC family protein [Pedobacter insulae]|uniref:DNA replication and repair protein RadC n=1 Tax=Pedobacter insulae TaxID=414048 RepID=A0A1I2Y3G1_9SPHI|nr:DNA repair protein RadC [Pedobacter insulae]SFH18861.1 DNA replication and repair protein RadC [Pedobacter insulae]
MENDAQKLGVKTWAEADRPREKLMLKGRRALTNAELIAILIGSGNRDESVVDLSKRILRYYENDLNKLAKLGVKELAKFKGIGAVKAMGIIAALELGRRRDGRENSKELLKIVSSKDADALFRPEMADLTQEEFWILLLNRSHRVIAKQHISKGGQAMTVVDPKVIFKVALEQNAASIILGHNHPSGNLTASSSDISITRKLIEAGKMLGLPVLDHLIITDHYFLSMADENLVDFN